MLYKARIGRFTQYVPVLSMQLPAVSGVTEWEMENAVSWKLGSHVTGLSDKYNGLHTCSGTA